MAGPENKSTHDITRKLMGSIGNKIMGYNKFTRTAYKAGGYLYGKLKIVNKGYKIINNSTNHSEDSLKRSINQKLTHCQIGVSVDFFKIFGKKKDDKPFSTKFFFMSFTNSMYSKVYRDVYMKNKIIFTSAESNNNDQFLNNNQLLSVSADIISNGGIIINQKPTCEKIDIIMQKKLNNDYDAAENLSKKFKDFDFDPDTILFEDDNKELLFKKMKNADGELLFKNVNNNFIDDILVDAVDKYNNHLNYHQIKNIGCKYCMEFINFTYSPDGQLLCNALTI